MTIPIYIAYTTFFKMQGNNKSFYGNFFDVLCLDVPDDWPVRPIA